MKPLKKLMLFLLIVPSISQAAPDYDVAQKLVMETTRQFTGAINLKKQQILKNPSLAVDMAEQTVFPHFNMQRMAKRVLARNWKTADAKQRQRFMNEFKRLLLNTYARTIVEYSDETIEYLPFKTGKKENRVIIRTQVKPATGQPIPIHYSMAFKDGLWKVIDVKIDGVSLVRNYRSTFSRDIRKDGLDKFLDRLAAKNKQQKGG